MKIEKRDILYKNEEFIPCCIACQCDTTAELPNYIHITGFSSQ